MSLAKTEEIKIRVPTALKIAVKHVADGRFTSESEIVREAIIMYLQTRNPEQLQDKPVSSGPAKAAAEAKIVAAVQEEVSYRKQKRQKKASK